MAFTNEYYVSATASGGGAGTEGDPWTLAEAASASVGSRINVKSGAYSSSGVTLSTVGSGWSRASTLRVWRGYNTTPGDLDGPLRDSDTPLDTTGFPVLTMTGAFVPSAYSAIMNLRIVGSISGVLFGTSAISSAVVANCSIENTAVNASAQALVLDNYCTLINSDIICSGSTHSTVFEMDSDPTIEYCRLVSTASGETVGLVRESRNISENVIYGSGGYGFDMESTNINLKIESNTFYNVSDAIRRPNAAGTSTYPHLLINNMCTDSSRLINNLYTTDDIYVFEFFSRTRDVTTPRSGVDADSINGGEVTTDTGGASTDYVNAAAGNLNLISSSPAVSVGCGIGSRNIGAAQSAPGAGGGGLLTHPGMNGGTNG